MGAELREAGGLMAIRSWSRQEEQVKKRLRDYRALVSKHRVCKELMDSLYPSTIQNITYMPKGGGEDLKMEILIDKRTNLHEQMQESLAAMQQEINTIIDMIKPLPPKEYTVITRYFLLGESMETVSCRIDVSVRHCWRYYTRAICRISENVIECQ